VALPTYEPTQEQKVFVKEYLAQGSVANRGAFDGDQFQQLFGITAQVIVTDALGLMRAKNENTFDGGWDLEWNGKKWDVKCEMRTVAFKKSKFVHNLVAKQIKYDVDGYIFVSYNKSAGEYTICGHIEKNDFLKHSSFHMEGSSRTRSDGTMMVVKNGTGGLYELEQKHLKPLPIGVMKYGN